MNEKGVNIQFERERGFNFAANNGKEHLTHSRKSKDIIDVKVLPRLFQDHAL